MNWRLWTALAGAVALSLAVGLTSSKASAQQQSAPGLSTLERTQPGESEQKQRDATDGSDVEAPPATPGLIGLQVVGGVGGTLAWGGLWLGTGALAGTVSAATVQSVASWVGLLGAPLVGSTLGVSWIGERRFGAAPRFETVAGAFTGWLGGMLLVSRLALESDSRWAAAAGLTGYVVLPAAAATLAYHIGQHPDDASSSRNHTRLFVGPHLTVGRTGGSVPVLLGVEGGF